MWALPSLEYIYWKGNTEQMMIRLIEIKGSWPSLGMKEKLKQETEAASVCWERHRGSGLGVEGRGFSEKGQYCI